ncbi:hypothetical protein LXL04_019583 [Taraxacum kok-saghyz]
MEDILDTTLDDISKPVWENMVESPIIDHVSASIPLCKYKLKLKYGGFFRLAKNTSRKIYCFGSQKCIYIDTWSYNLSRLNEEVIRRYDSKMHLHRHMVIQFENSVEFKRALNHHAIINEFDYLIQKSDQSRFSARCEKLDCEWRIYASIMQDGISFEVRKIGERHTCTRSNKGGNKRATQGWIANIIVDKLRSDGDVSPWELRNWIMKTYNVEIPYQKVFRGKQQAYIDMYGKWEDSFMKMDAFREELLNRNQGSVVEIDFDVVGDKKHFKRFFISLAACSRGFVAGCRPYVSLDACHLKGKFNGVLAAATGVDANNSIFPIAYSVLESENTQSWTWFLESLKKSIGTPSGLVISSDMQKGLEVAIMHVYPNVEHRECIRHLFSNFKKQFRGEFFSKKLWDAANTYLPASHAILLNEISDVSQAAIKYLNNNHKKVWSKSKFGTTSKCDYNTNNISESFNSWIGALRYQPVLDLLDGVREKLIKRFDNKRMLVKKWNGVLVPIAKNHLEDISKNLGEYEVSRCSDNHAEVKCKGKRWEVNLYERKCSCRVWQVTGLPCVHASAFIAFTRDVNWDKYVDSCYTVQKVKEAYAFEIAPMPGADQWMQKEWEKIYPPIIKRPVGRPKKKRIKSSGESKRRHKCPRCCEYGHREKTCKNPAPQDLNASQTSTSKRRSKCPR